jgi:peptide/nickel transport system substrate-binding protein
MDKRFGSKIVIGFVLCITLAGLMLAGCTSPSTSPAATATPQATVAPTNGTIVSMEYGEPGSLDFATDDGYDSASYEVVQACYETLFYFNGGDVTTPVGVLATGYNVSPDGLVYTIYLRPNVKFHDGTAFNASAVKYSLDRLMLVNNGPAYGNFMGDIKGFNAYNANYDNTTQADVDAYLAAGGIKVINETTVQITLESADSAFIKKLTFAACSIMSPTFDQAHGGFNATAHLGNPYMVEHECGTGPFKLDSWEHKNAVTLVRNPDYWGKPAMSAKVIIKDVEDWNTRLLAGQAGDADLILVDALHAPEVRNDPRFVFQTNGTLTVGAVYFNYGMWPFNDSRVRQAFVESFNKTLYVDTATNGYATAKNGPIPAGLPGGDLNLTPQTFNPTHAKQLLLDAGFKASNKTTVELKYNSGNTNRQRIATMLADQINSYSNETGLTVKVTEMAWPEYVAAMNQKKLPLYIVGWQADYPGTDNFLSAYLYSKGYYMGLVNNPGNATVDSLYEQSLKETDQTKQVALYKQMIDIINNDYAYLWTTQAQNLLCYRAGLKGVVYNPMNGGLGVNYYTIYK